MKCEWCMWAIKSYGQIVACMACDEECPTDDDITAARKEGYCAYNGCSCEPVEE